jgi:membrane associated rhomboid family serine protease
MRPPQSWRRARVTIAIAVATALAWLIPLLLGARPSAVNWSAFIPGRFGGAESGQAMAPLFLTPLTATLAHADFIHLGLNLLILLFCGRSVENVLGPLALGILYVAGAYAAAAAQFLLDPMPMIGASGAISAVLAAYTMLFGRNRAKVAHPTLALWLNALWVGAAWVGLQLLVGFAINSAAGPVGLRVAIAAHVGGFLVGLLLAKPLLLLRYRKA